MSSSTTDKKIITLKSSDGVIFELDENAAVVSDLLKQMIEEGSTDEKAIPMHNVTGKILSKVVEYCTRHAEPVGEDAAANREDELEAFDAEFVKVDQETLFEMLLAANYMIVKGLFDLTCKTAADMIKGKTPEEVREFFNIVNDYTPQEEQEVRAQNAWAFE